MEQSIGTLTPQSSGNTVHYKKGKQLWLGTATHLVYFTKSESESSESDHDIVAGSSLASRWKKQTEKASNQVVDYEKACSLSYHD